MVTVTLDSQIRLDVLELSSSLFHQLKKDLTLPNPSYEKSKKYGFGTNDVPSTIPLYTVQDDMEMVLPRGYGSTLFRYFKQLGINPNVIDRRLLLPEVHFQSNVKLRDYQEEAVQKLLYWRQGGIVAPCGAGKTIIMLEAMARMKQPALWITHTKELAEQVIERAEDMFGIEAKEIGFIGDGRHSIGERLTVALVQTLSKADLAPLVNRFGALFIDEAHHMAARSFFYPIGEFPALYRVWVSATPEREDGLTKMVFTAGGPIVHTISQDVVPTIIPELRVMETDFICDTFEYNDVVNAVIEDKNRNRLIVETIASHYKNNYSLVLSDRLIHLKKLLQLLQDRLPAARIAILTGAMKKKERAAVMEQVKNKEIDLLLATQLAREGLDIRHLNRLYLVSPKKAAAAVQQEVGRIMRPEEGKEDAICFDFYDHQHGILRSQFWKRLNVYRTIGMNTDLNKVTVHYSTAVGE